MFAHPRFSQPGVGHSLAAKLWLVAGLIAASFLPAADAAFQPEAISQLVPCASLEELSDAQLSLADRAKTPYECLAIVYRDALLEIWKHGLSFNFGQLNRSEYNMLYAKYASPWLTPITLTDQLHAPQHNAGNPQSGSATSAIALSASDEENIITAGKSRASSSSPQQQDLGSLQHVAAIRHESTEDSATATYADRSFSLVAPYDPTKSDYRLLDFLPVPIRGLIDYNFIEEDFPLPSNENGTHPRPSTTPTGPFGFHLYNRSILVPNCWATVYEVLRFVAQCRLDGPTRFKSLENISWDVYSTDDSHMQAVLSKFTRRVEGCFRFLEDALLASRTESSIEGQVLISNNGFRQEHHKSVEYVLNHTLQDQDLLSMEAILGSTRKIEASQKSIRAVQNSTVQHSADEKVHNDIDHGMQIGGEDDGPRFGDILLIYNEDPDFTRAVLEHAVLFVDQTIVFEKAGTGRLNPYRLINLKTVLREWPPANVGAKTGIFSWHLHRVWSWEDRPLLRNLSEGDFVKQFSLSGSPVDRRWPMLWQWPAEDRRQYTLGVGDDPRSRTGEVDEIVLLQARRYGLCRSRARPRLVPCAGRREAGGPPNADGPREGHPAQEWGQEARDLDDSWFRSVPVFV